MKNKIFLLLVFIISGVNAYSQFSKTHYIPPLVKESSNGEYYIYISTPTASNVKFKITEVGGAVISGTVNNNTPYVYTINNPTQLFVDKNQIGIVANKGFIVEAEDLIYVSVRINADRNNNGSFSQGGGIVSKGNSALGKEFRLGAMLNPVYHANLLNFASILSTENATKITISNIPNGTILTDGTVISGPITITLNKNESYVLALKNFDDGSTGNSNSSKIIGALVESDKPVVINTGSYEGTNSALLNSQGNSAGRDIGFDQIVSFEKTGREYIFVKGQGTDELERILLIAHKDNTQIFTNGNSTPFITLNRGKYILIDGSEFINGNLYISTSENVFAYQSIGGTTASPNQNMFFVPPLNCATPNIVDNIPNVEFIGNTQFNGGLNIVTEAGATLMVNGTAINSSSVAVTGNPGYIRYSMDGLHGNVSVKSTGQVYVSYFGNNGVATYGGYYSGFDTKPEIVNDKISANSADCLPNVTLKISSFSSYDIFEWYYNDSLIAGATQNSYTPTQPGYYQVKGRISGCPDTKLSDRIPVSLCPEDSDGDGTNNNLDIDLDNDGIINSVETRMAPLDQSDPDSGNNYTGATSGNGTIAGKPLYGFTSTVPAGLIGSQSYSLNLPIPQTISLRYITQNNPDQSTSASEYLNSEGDFILRVPRDKTISLYDPMHQLLVDTNYDGIYESEVTNFSSFEIKFRLKSTTSLTPGSGSFIFTSYLTNAITLVHNNLSDSQSNTATFMYIKTETYDSDKDGISDLLDIDSDNDGIPDTLEAQGNRSRIFSGKDTNGNGLDDAFEPGFITLDTDKDNVPDYLDLDSDNDGIFDRLESGSASTDSNNDGIIDGNPNTFGINGLFDNLETTKDSGELNYSISDSDTDGFFDSTEIDSDNDGCFDVTEAGFPDGDMNGILGNSPDSVDENGKITGLADGYTTPYDENNNGVYDFQEDTILKAGSDNEVAFCTNQETVDLFDYLGENASRGGSWTTKSGAGNFDPSVDPAGIYTYTVDNGACGSKSAELTVKVDQAPNAGENSQIELCSEDAPVDLFTILGGSPDSTGTWVPELGSHAGVFDLNTDAPGIYTYTVENGSCSPASAQVEVAVITSPNAGISTSMNICVNSNPIDLFESLQGNPQHGGSWTPELLGGDGILDPAKDPQGTYTYTVNKASCGSASAVVTVTYESPYLITQYSINTNEFSDNNTIEIEVGEEGAYEFSLDGINYQVSKLFQHLEGGEHEVFIREINGCAHLEKTILILDYQKFFTPNNDGYNDVWQIKGTKIPYQLRIFNRYGKLFKVLKNNETWDGKFNGKELPGNDYWFEVTLSDGTIKSGHFSLVR
jgi:gliding motility-associated-like protein